MVTTGGAEDDGFPPLNLIIATVIQSTRTVLQEYTDGDLVD
jgi:hypothetical protein